MANYNTRVITSAEVYQRTNRITIDNLIDDYPTVTFNEENVYIFDNNVSLKMPLDPLVKVVNDMNELVPMVDPVNDLPTGHILSLQKIYNILYSCYRYFALTRDNPTPSLSVIYKCHMNGNYEFIILRNGQLTISGSIEWQMVGCGENPITAAELQLTDLPSGSFTFESNDFYKTILIPMVENVTLTDRFKIVIQKPANFNLEVTEVIATDTNCMCNE